MGNFRKGTDQMASINSLVEGRHARSIHGLPTWRRRPTSDFPVYEVLEVEPGVFVAHAQGREVCRGAQWEAEVTARRFNMRHKPKILR